MGVFGSTNVSLGRIYYFKTTLFILKAPCEYKELFVYLFKHARSFLGAIHGIWSTFRELVVSLEVWKRHRAMSYDLKQVCAATL